MRLICPNCDAQYEVPSEVIPEDGRDVQCSNCGDTWFQAHPDLETTETDQAESPAPDQTAEPEPEPATDTEPDPVEVSETAEPAASTFEQSKIDIEEPYEEDEPESIVA
ncbi:MAG: zinc-ribbon domain-containing protein, partial [Paracoccaceae bacterium]